MADAMDRELEAEMKKQREAIAAEARRKAQLEALSDLNRMPDEPRQQQQQQPGSSSSAAPSKAPVSGGGSSNPTGAFIPAHWNTAGRETELSPQNAQTQLAPGTVIESESISMAMCGCGGPGGGAGTQFFAMAGLHPPSDASFEAYFRNWFEMDHFPGMSEDLKRELVNRAKSKGFFSGLSSQVKKWAMANTDARLQSDVWCTYFIQNAPPRMRVFGPMKTASVNLGSQVTPCWITFFGLPESETQRLSGGGTGSEGAHWTLPPFCGGNGDIASIMDELDGRGGMAALIGGSLDMS